MKTYKLHCGHLDYEVTSEAKKAVDGLMYWTHVKELETKSGNIHAFHMPNIGYLVRWQKRRSVQGLQTA